MSDDLPMGWVETTLSEIGNWGSGGTPKATNHQYYNGSIPWAKIGDLNDGIVVRTEDAITEEGLLNSSAKIVEEGTLLIAMYGSIGKLGIAGTRLATNQAIAFCNIFENLILKKFAFYYLRSRREHLLSMGQGGTQQNISQTILKAYPALFPPLNEQRRIVDKLERIGDRHRTARNELNHIPKLIVRYKQAVLAAAFRGDLTADWRNHSLIFMSKWQIFKLGDICDMKAGDFVSASDIFSQFSVGLYPCFGGNGLRGYTKTYTHEGEFPLIGRQGALCGNVHLVKSKFHATEHAIVVSPLIHIDVDFLALLGLRG